MSIRYETKVSLGLGINKFTRLRKSPDPAAMENTRKISFFNTEEELK